LKYSTINVRIFQLFERYLSLNLNSYYLCHTDVRCTKAVFVPAPIHYVTLCVSRGLNLDCEGEMANEQRSIAT
jgi:hypothetical protein